MDFQVLGPVEARKGGVRIALSGSKVHTVLASLLLARGRVVSDDRLSSMLWGWEPPATAGAQIYTYMSRLRKLLGADVEIDRRPPGYVLRAPHSTIDLLEFEQLDREGRTALGRGRHREASTQLSRALGLWRGAALGNVTEYLAGAELARLEELRLHALESRVEADLELGRHEQLTAELTGLVAEFPLREKLRAQLMTAFFRCGQQADALHTYHEGRKVLDEQLGIEPGEALGATYQAVLVGSLGARSRNVTPLRPTVSAAYADGDGGDLYGPSPATLPPDIEDFIGREEELAALCGQLAESRKGGGPRALLVTGMAGVGKTALAVRAAHRSAGHFPDGQLFAELAHSDGRPKRLEEVLTVLLNALGAPVEGTGRGAGIDELIRRYRTRTAGRRLLVVLDGAVDSRELDLLLPGSAAAAVLITGRARLTRVTQARTTVLTPSSLTPRTSCWRPASAGEGCSPNPRPRTRFSPTARGCRSRCASRAAGWPPGRTGRSPGWRRGSRSPSIGCANSRTEGWSYVAHCFPPCGSCPDRPGARSSASRGSARSPSPPSGPPAIWPSRSPRPRRVWNTWWTPRCSTSAESTVWAGRCTASTSWSCSSRSLLRVHIANGRGPPRRADDSVAHGSR